MARSSPASSISSPSRKTCTTISTRWKSPSTSSATASSSPARKRSRASTSRFGNRARHGVLPRLAFGDEPVLDGDADEVGGAAHAELRLELATAIGDRLVADAERERDLL